MRKLSAILIGLLILGMVLAACQQATPKATEAPTKPFRVAVVMPSKINDLAFSQSMYDALVAV